MKLLIAVPFLLLQVTCPPLDPLPPPAASPSPTAEPTPTASPTAEPTPVPTPAATPDNCVLPPLLGECADNPSWIPLYQGAVMMAQEELASRGYLKDGKVIDPKAYIDAIAVLVRQAGVCARNGSEMGHTTQDEVWVGRGTDAENYDVIISDGRPWTHFAYGCRQS